MPVSQNPISAVSISDKQKQILILLADGQFHSGTELAEVLGISRSAIWKQLNSLTELGLAYSAVSGKGYRLDKPLQLLSDDVIRAQLDPLSLNLLASLEIFDEIDSTNRYLLEQAGLSAVSGRVCFAEQQSAGRGRRGRTWVSPFGSNIYVSILWRFQHGYASTAGLSLAMGVAVIRALRDLAVSDVGLKWPNDIYFQGKKLGGILIEITGEADGPCAAVIGLGLNCYLPEAEGLNITQAWTDLSRITSEVPDRNHVAAALLAQLLTVLAEFESTGIAAFLDEWRSYDCRKDQAATLFIDEQAFSGVLRGVDDKGLLLLEQADGKVRAFASGEVSFSPAVS